MTQNKLTTWWGKKNKTSYGKLSAGTAVDTPVNIAYRKALNHVHIRRFVKNFFSMSSDPCQL